MSKIQAVLSPLRNLTLNDKDKHSYSWKNKMYGDFISTNQILELDGIYLICDGEIYNYKQEEFTFKTNSTCEVILHLYKKYGFHNTITKLDGEFACVLYDSSKNIIYVSRDKYGIKPLYMANKLDGSIAFASTLKQLENFSHIVHFTGGAVLEFPANEPQSIKMQIIDSYRGKHLAKFHDKINFTEELLVVSVHKRLKNKIGILLSGSLKSSIIVGIASKIMPVENITVFTVGKENAVIAKKITEYFGIKEHIIVENETFDKSEVVEIAETYNGQAVYDSVSQLSLAKYISKNTDIKVVLSGESIDATDQNELERLKDEFMYNGCSKNVRTMSYYGIEVRFPFLDYNFMNFAMSLEPSLKIPINNLLKNTFSKLLPPNELYFEKKEEKKEDYRSLFESIYPQLK